MSRSLTFSNVLQFYWQNRLSRCSWSKNCQHVYHYLLANLGYLPVRELTLSIFEEFLDKQAKKYSASYVNHHIIISKAAFNFCIRRGMTKENPLKYVEHRKMHNIQRRVITEAEFDKLYQAIIPHYRPWLKFIYLCPTRKMEVLSLRNPHDLDLYRGVLIVQDINSKTGEGRLLPIPESMMPYFKSIPAASKYIFFRPNGSSYHPYDSRGVLRMLQRLCIKTGLQHVNVHAFRRTAAVNLLKKGVDVRTICLLGGWKSPDVLFNRYLPLCDSHLKSAIQRVDYVN